MSADSIFSHLTAENTVAEIDFILSADYRRERTVVLLEGEDDVKVFRFLVSDDVTLIKAYGASTTVDKLIPSAFPDERRVIGIRDHDYLKRRTHPRIFWCDRCCCEMMLLSDPETFERVCVNFYRGELGATELRDEILTRLYYISSARLLSQEMRLGLRLSDTDLASVIGPELTPSVDTVLRFLRRYNDKKVTAKFVAAMKKLPSPPPADDLLEITNGHDFLAVLSIYVCGKRRTVSERELGGALRCAYSLSAFRKTRLYRELVAYGDENSLEIVAK